MKIAFFSPLNPTQSGISDYSEELLLTLAGARLDNTPLDIDLFIDRGYRPSNADITRRFDVLPARTYDRAAAHYDATLYQMGNSPAHAYIYRQLMRHRGVVVMHEFVLHHLRIWMALNGGRRREYLDVMERLHGEEGREAARRVMLGQFPEGLFKYQLSEEVINHATGVIVHSNYMAGLVRGVRPDVPLSIVPMGVPLPPLIPKGEARANLGLDHNLFLVTSVGHLNPYKRVSATLRAFKALLMEVPNSLYLLIGSRSPNYDPTRQIEMLDLSNSVKSTGYVPQDEFAYYLAASDVCLNLRYPTAGETSASLLRIMGAGVPALVSRTGAFEELPDDAVGKIDVDDTEEELLLEYLLLLAHRSDVRAAMSLAARRYVAEHHTLEQAARGYLDSLLALAGRQAEISIPATSAFTPVSVASPSVKRIPEHLLRASPQSKIQNPKSKIDGTLLDILAEAAADLGIHESDDTVLQSLSGALDGLIPSDDSHSAG
jgi:glycosyltransferase involved in cell wall biosynthesis